MHGRSLLKRHLFEKIVTSHDFENWLYIVGGTELMHGFPTGGAWNQRWNLGYHCWWNVDKKNGAKNPFLKCRKENLVSPIRVPSPNG